MVVFEGRGLVAYEMIPALNLWAIPAIWHRTKKVNIIIQNQQIKIKKERKKKLTHVHYR